ncbi:hypothetical protein [Sphingopyxis sp. PET50]|uniref:hypothetical protein n=1 Tax=Sphingopyxis sp. PET50 TaxID=2976533 RepID=UPI0021AF88AF|nr:hypothetical protein [Sphingopyxis sp. PET50]
MLRRIAPALLCVAAPAHAADAGADLNLAWAAGYRAAFTCSALWNGAGKSLDAIERDELTGLYPEIEAGVRALKADVDDRAKRVSVRYRDDMPPRVAEWDSRTGCVTLPIGAAPRPRGDYRPGQARSRRLGPGRWAMPAPARPCRAPRRPMKFP